MNYFIYDTNGTKVAPLQNITSIQWMPRYYTSGTAEIHVRPTDDNRKYLKKWNRVVCQERREILFIDYVHESDDISEDMVIRGYMDNIGAMVNLYTETITNIESGLLKILTRNKRKRDINVAAAKGLSPEFVPAVTTTYGDIREMFEEYCQNAMTYKADTDEWLLTPLGWREVVNGDTLNYLEIYQGSIKNAARFSDDLGNVVAQYYEDNVKEYRNVAYVYGEGDGASRTRVTVIKKRNTSEPNLELYVDARDLQSSSEDENGETVTISNAEYTKRLKKRGYEKLAETAADAYVYKCTLSAIDQLAVLGQDYDLGDVVPILSRRFNKFTYARVVGINFVEEENINTQVSLELALEYQEELV